MYQPLIDSEHANLKIVDGGAWDLTAVTSLVARKVKNIVTFINVLIDVNTTECDSIATLFGLPTSHYRNFYPNGAAKIFSNELNEYKTTMEGMYNNYRKQGIYYWKGTYTTVQNSNLDVSPYRVNVLWIGIASSPQFIETLSQTNKEIIERIHNFPYVCISMPSINDCNNNSNCTPSCPENSPTHLVKMIASFSNSMQASTSEANALCLLGSWICKKVIVPFLRNSQ